MASLRNQIDHIVYIISRLFRCMRTESHDFIESDLGNLSLVALGDAEVEHQNDVLDFQSHLSSILFNYFNDEQIEILYQELRSEINEIDALNRLLDRSDFNTRTCFMYEDLFICAMSIVMAICGQIIIDNSYVRAVVKIENEPQQENNHKKNTLKFPKLCKTNEEAPKGDTIQ